VHELHAGARDGVALPARDLRAIERGVTTPMRLFNVVLLPAPLRPRSATTSPFSTRNDTSKRMWESP
jgi:hypothetical protein